MRSQAMEDLFMQELGEIYSAEKQIYKGLAQMASAASNSELKAAFETHRKQTKQQIARLEKSFRILDEKADGSAPGVAGLIKQTKALVASDGYDPAVTDAGLITSAQKIEHYEIAAYGCLRTHARILGYEEIEELLQESLKEEEETDALLTQIAQNSVNVSAAAAPYSQARKGSRHDLDRILKDSRQDSHLSLGKLALGLAIGGALSILFSPRSGQETREKLRESWRGATRRAHDAADAVSLY